MKTPFRGAPLFAQVMGLVILSLLAVPVISGVLIFSLPPPPPEIYRLGEISTALRSVGTYEVAESRPLVVKLKAEPPDEAPRRSRWRETFRRELATSLGVTPDRIRISTDGPARILYRAERRPETRLFRGPPAGSGERGPPPGPPPGEGAAIAILPGADWTRRVPNEQVIFAPFKVGVKQADGRWLVAKPQPVLRFDSWQARIGLTFLLSILTIAPLAWLLARRLAAPMSAFAEAADRLGRDPRAPPLHMRGSAEVTAASAAFNRMQERLRRYVDDRTAMVAAIAHDLRTPLTRLKFRIEAAPDALRPKLAADIDQMEAMIAATLSFVTDATRPRERTPLELASLIESVLDEAAETGADAAVDRTEKLVIEGDPVALRRLAANLVDNALKYGGKARGRVFREDDHAVIEIDDEGPGIPPQEAERVFEPFFRGEPSRNRETGGIGLGLAVVRSVARAHGGDAELVNRPEGGLTARVRLPL
jgi:signal transduction histidine kinase